MSKVLLTTICILWGIAGHAAEQTLERNLDDIIDGIEITLANETLEVSEFAQTDRFAIFYVHREGDSTLTITAYQLPEQPARTTLSVHTDSPRNQFTEKTFLDKLIAWHTPAKP